MGFQNANHFGLDAEDGILEWKAIIPGGDGIIYLGAHHQPYGISMFHQLRCLDIVRDEVVRDRSDGDNISELGRHCLNYIRQMVMCRGDLEFESFRSRHTIRSTCSEYTSVRIGRGFIIL